MSHDICHEIFYRLANGIGRPFHGLSPNTAQLVDHAAVIDGVAHPNHHATNNRVIDLGRQPDLFTQDSRQLRLQLLPHRIIDLVSRRQRRLDPSCHLIVQAMGGRTNRCQAIEPILGPLDVALKSRRRAVPVLVPRVASARHSPDAAARTVSTHHSAKRCLHAFFLLVATQVVTLTYNSTICRRHP